MLTQFGATSPTLGATKPGRKSTSRSYSTSSQQTTFALDDLDSTRNDFSLRTPRLEISSHFLISLITDSVIYKSIIKVQ